MENNIAFLARHKHETSFVRFVLLMLSQPAFLISLMVVDEQFSLLEHFVNLNTTYYSSLYREVHRTYKFSIVSGDECIFVLLEML